MVLSPIEEIKSRLDIVQVIGDYVKLQKAGANFRALCPFHSEKTPSFFVSPARQIWRCFGACGEGGDIFKFIMKIEGVEFGDALRILAKKAGVKLKPKDPALSTARQRLYQILELACRFYEAQLKSSKIGAQAKDYLMKRGLSEESISQWRLGFAPAAWEGLFNFLRSKGYQTEEIMKSGLAILSEKETAGSSRYYDRFRQRIMFPIFDLNSQVVGFGGRIFEVPGSEDNQKESLEPKYVNTPATLLYDKSRILYGLDKAKVAIRKKDSCVVVEGYLDAILAFQAGTLNVVASSGTALTPFHLDILSRYTQNLFLAFDMDLAGDTATKRGIELAQEKGFNLRIVSLPQGKDPAELILTSPKLWQKSLEESRDVIEFYFESVFKNFSAKRVLAPSEKVKIAKELLPILKKVSNRILQDHWLQELAQRLQTKVEVLEEELQKIKKDEKNLETAAEIKNSVTPKSRKVLLQEAILTMLFKNQNFGKLIKESQLRFFEIPYKKFLEILLVGGFLKERGKEEFSEKIKSFSEAEKDLLNYLMLKAEVEETDFHETDFEKSLNELKKEVIKEELAKFTQELKEAEKNEDKQKIDLILMRINDLIKELKE
jgi:DNA primase